MPCSRNNSQLPLTEGVRHAVFDSRRSRQRFTDDGGRHRSGRRRLSRVGRSPELNAPRRRITTPAGVRVSVHPGGVPSVGGIGVLAHAEHVAVSKEVQTYHDMGGPVTVLFDVKDASLMGIVVGRIGIAEIEAERPTPMRTAATSAVGTLSGARGCENAWHSRCRRRSQASPHDFVKSAPLRNRQSLLPYGKDPQRVLPHDGEIGAVRGQAC
jgi:hypothetical protein